MSSSYRVYMGKCTYILCSGGIIEEVTIMIHS